MPQLNDNPRSLGPVQQGQWAALWVLVLKSRVAVLEAGGGGGGTGSPGGSNTNIQYNSSGAFAGSNDLTYDGSDLYLNGNAGIQDNTFDYPLTVGGTGAQDGYGNKQLAVISSATEAGITIQNATVDGRKYGIMSTGTGSGVGAGLFIICDSTTGATRLSIDSTGQLALPGVSQGLTAGNIYLSCLLDSTTGDLVRSAGAVVKVPTGNTSDATPTNIYAINVADTIPNDGDFITLEAKTRIKNDAATAFGYLGLVAMAKNVGGTITVISNKADFPPVVDAALTTANSTFTTDGSTKIFFTATGVAATNISWYPTLTYTIN